MFIPPFWLWYDANIMLTTRMERRAMVRSRGKASSKGIARAWTSANSIFSAYVSLRSRAS